MTDFQALVTGALIGGMIQVSDVMGCTAEPMMEDGLYLSYFMVESIKTGERLKVTVQVAEDEGL